MDSASASCNKVRPAPAGRTTTGAFVVFLTTLVAAAPPHGPAPAATPAEASIDLAIERGFDGRGGIRRLAQPDTELVRSLQTIFRALGLYRGGDHGRMDAATERAVRRFQIHAGLEPNGQVSPDLLVAAEQRRRERLLVDRLRTARQAEISAARRTLVGVHQVLAGFDRPRRQSDGTPVAAGACSPPLKPACLLAEAYASASRAPGTRTRDWALGEIASLQAQARLIEPAVVTLRQIDDPRLVLVGLTRLAAAYAEVGDGDRALALALAPGRPVHRARLALAVARIQCNGGDGGTVAFRHVAAALEAMADPWRRLELHAEAAVIAGRSRHCRGRSEHLAAARTLARRLDDPALAEHASRLVAAAAVDIGHVAAGAAMLDAVSDSDTVAAVLARIATEEARRGRFDRALATLERIRPVAAPLADRHLATAFAEIARLQAARGALTASQASLERGLAAAARIPQPVPRSHAHFQLMRAALEVRPRSAQTLALAERAGSSIEHARMRATTLWLFALDHRRRGDAVKAGPAQALAERTTAQLPPARRVSVHAETVRHLAVIGDLGAARGALARGVDAARTLSDPLDRARALTVMAGAGFELTAATGHDGDESGVER